jgi:hypothetical protein
VQPFAEQALTEKNHVLEDFFAVVEKEMDIKGENKTEDKGEDKENEAKVNRKTVHVCADRCVILTRGLLKKGPHCTVIRIESKLGLNLDGVTRILLSQTTLCPVDGYP